MTNAIPPAISGDPTALGGHGLFQPAVTDLRYGPSPQSPVIRRVLRNTPARLMGATGAWLRVQLEDGTAGYVTGGSVRVAGAADPRELES